MKKEVLNPKDKILIDVLTACIDIAFETKEINNFRANKTTKELLLKEDFDANQIVSRLNSLSVRVHENKLFVQTEDFKFSFPITNAPELLKTFKYNLKRDADIVFSGNGYLTTFKDVKVFKNYSLYPHKKDTPYFIGDGNKLQIFEIANSNLQNAIKANEQDKTKQSKNLVDFFQNELKLLSQCVGENWDQELAEMQERAEAETNDKINSFIEKNRYAIDTINSIYMPTAHGLFKLLKKYSQAPTNDIDIILPILLTEQIGDDIKPNFNAYVETVKNDIESETIAYENLFNTKGRLKKSHWRYIQYSEQKKKRIEGDKNLLQALFKYESEIKTLLDKHCTNLM